MNVAWNGIGQNRMESNIAALPAFHLGVRTVALLCNRDPLYDRCSRQPFGSFSKKLMTCIIVKNTRLSRLPLLNLFQIEALKGTSHLQTLMSYEILCVSLIPGRLYVWKCWQVGDFQLLHWNQRGIVGQPDKVLRHIKFKTMFC